MASPHDLHPCFVLHRRDYSDTSLLTELFCRGLGRFPAIAKGAKRGRSPTTALLQPFRPVLAACTGRGEVRTLTRVEPGSTVPPLTGRGLYCGFYLNELLMQLLGRNDPHDGLFDHYAAALEALTSDPDTARVLRRFELRLLEEAGYALVLEREADGGPPVRPGVRYLYFTERGPVPAALGEEGPTLDGATLQALAADAPLSPEQSREARELMRRVIDHHLGGRPLKSRELFRAAFPIRPMDRPT